MRREEKTQTDDLWTKRKRKDSRRFYFFRLDPRRDEEQKAFRRDRKTWGYHRETLIMTEKLPISTAEKLAYTK